MYVLPFTDNPVKTTLQKCYAYLRKNLSIDNELSAKLFGWKPQLLDEPTFAEIRALNEHNKPYEAFQKRYQFAELGYTEEFCECLEEVGKDAPHTTLSSISSGNTAYVHAYRIAGKFRRTKLLRIAQFRS